MGHPVDGELPGGAVHKENQDDQLHLGLSAKSNKYDRDEDDFYIFFQKNLKLLRVHMPFYSFTMRE